MPILMIVSLMAPKCLELKQIFFFLIYDGCAVLASGCKKFQRGQFGQRRKNAWSTEHAMRAAHSSKFLNLAWKKPERRARGESLFAKPSTDAKYRKMSE
jgi:hypothetical protein